jgi:hypothetical protein
MGSVTGITPTGINFPHPEPHTSASLAPAREELRMFIFMEKIDPPPPIQLTDEERLKLKLSEDDLWVRNFIDHLGGVIRELKRK